MPLNSEKLAEKAAKLALTKKAERINILNLKKLTSITDYFVICSGSTDIQVKAIADAITDGLKKEARPWHIEGYSNLQWVLLDYVDVVVHVFQNEIREYYDLERLWADAEFKTVSENKQNT